MKRFALCSLLFALCSLLLLTVMGCGDDDSGGTSGPVMVVLGDSLSAGHSLAPTNPPRWDLTKSWPTKFGKYVEGIKIVNSSESDLFAAQGLEQINKRALAHKPKVVVVQLGANDLFAMLNGLADDPTAITPDKLTARIFTPLGDIVDKLVEAKIEKIYVTKFYTPAIAYAFASQSTVLDNSMIPGLLALFDGIFTGIKAKGANITIIDNMWEKGDINVFLAGASASSFGTYKVDSNHPNEAGCEIIAEIFFDEMYGWLNENGFVKAEYKK